MFKGHSVEFSHEFEAGPSGPARSYWNVKYGPDQGAATVGMICLHHRSMMDAESQATSIAFQLDQAVQRGRREAQADFRRAIGLTNPTG